MAVSSLSREAREKMLVAMREAMERGEPVFEIEPPKCTGRLGVLGHNWVIGYDRTFEKRYGDGTLCSSTTLDVCLYCSRCEIGFGVS